MVTIQPQSLVPGVLRMLGPGASRETKSIELPAAAGVLADVLRDGFRTLFGDVRDLVTAPFVGLQYLARSTGEEGAGAAQSGDFSANNSSEEAQSGASDDEEAWFRSIMLLAGRKVRSKKRTRLIEALAGPHDWDWGDRNRTATLAGVKINFRGRSHAYRHFKTFVARGYWLETIKHLWPENNREGRNTESLRQRVNDLKRILRVQVGLTLGSDCVGEHRYSYSLLNADTGCPIPTHSSGTV